MTEQKNTPNKDIIENMFKVGAHFAYSKSRRHPSISPFIFGVKNKVEIFDLEKTSDLLASAKEFIKKIAKEGKQILLVGGKSEARNAIRTAGQLLAMPYVDGRWIGGALTNFTEIRKRVEKYERLVSEREKGELSKYTKKERLLIDRQIEKLEKLFFGLINMKEMPKAIIIVDPKKEKNAIAEANEKGIPVVALLGSDCNISDAKYPIVGNDSSKTSIEFFIKELTNAYEEGKKSN